MSILEKLSCSVGVLTCCIFIVGMMFPNPDVNAWFDRITDYVLAFLIAVASYGLLGFMVVLGIVFVAVLWLGDPNS